MILPLEVPLSVEDPCPLKILVGEEVKPVIVDYDKLIHKPSLNGIIIEGDHDSEYYKLWRPFVYNQNVASADWYIEHNLNRHPSVTVTDSAGTVVIGDIQYLDNNSIRIKFSGAFSGTAYLN